MMLKQIIKEYKAYFLQAELLIACIFGIIFAIWIERYSGYKMIAPLLKDNRGAIYGTFAAIFGSLLGFSITAVSIVLGIAVSQGANRLAVVRESKNYQALWIVFISTIRWLGLATLVALVNLIFDRDANPHYFLLCVFFWASLTAIIRLIRCMRIFELIIIIATREHQS